MEEFTENKEMNTIGGMLREARIKKNITLEAASEELCIRKYYLNAIENMDFENLPPMPYCLGFVRSYAQLLGLNSDRMVLSYRQVMTGEEETRPLHENNRSENSAPRIKHFILGALGLALLIAAWSVLPTTAKFEDISEEDAVVVPEPVIVSEDEEDKAVIAKAKQKEKINKKKEDIKAKEDKKKVSEEQKKVKEETDVKDIKEKKKENKEKDKKAKEAALPTMKIVLTGPSWLELRQGNKVLLNNVYSKGYTYEIPSGKGLVISVGRPRNVQFFLNDKQIQVASNINRKKISLDSYFKKQD